MIMHIVLPRTGSDNAGDVNCVACNIVVFDENGQVVYLVGDDHTTDYPTYIMHDDRCSSTYTPPIVE